MFPDLTKVSGVDLLTALEESARENSRGAAALFLENVSRPLPDDIKVSEEEIDLATRFFVHHSVGIMQSLMHFSLAGGFAR
jgi:hypothetical protein